MNHPTSAKLRDDIDHGRGGDKVDVVDPAVAPLGTDDEAAGTPPAPNVLHVAHEQEIQSPSPGAAKSAEKKDFDGALGLFVAVIVGVAVVFGLTVWLLG